MTVKELKEALADYPDDMVVVYQVFEEPELCNFIDGMDVRTDEYGDTWLWLYED